MSSAAEDEAVEAGDVKLHGGVFGKYTFDKRLNSEGGVVEFATLNAAKPTTVVRQTATHEESNGKNSTRTVVDLDKEVDISAHVSEEWEWQDYENIERYVKASSQFKRLAIKKCVDPMPDLCSNITAIVKPHYSNVYRSHYYCCVTTTDSTIYIYPDTKTVRALRSTGMTVGFFIGGLVIGGVVFLAVRHAMTKTYKAKMHYPFLVEEDALWEEFQDKFLEGTRAEGARDRAEEAAERQRRKAEEKEEKQRRKRDKKEKKNSNP
ncbi:hypothetical protein QOT17_008247 [Balamuthia mandrillaris]